MEFKANYDAYWMRVLTLENNKTKAYALFKVTILEWIPVW
jgi:hypothetical protein